MFDNIKIIPYTRAEISEQYEAYDALFRELCEYINDYRVINVRWQSYNSWDTIARLLVRINAINAEHDTDKKAIMRHYLKNDHPFLHELELLKEHPARFGLIIHEQASTHYVEADYPGYTHLEGAEKVLKQTPTHFLKIMKHPISEVLVVFTNKELTIENCYKLNELQTKLYVDKYSEVSTIPYEIAKACSNKDVEKFKEIINNLFNSEEFKQLRMEKIRKIFTYDTERQILNLESSIQDTRNRIMDYENRIAADASDIRMWSERLIQLRNKDINEEIDLICKYLWKHPYIKEYNPLDNGQLLLKFEAPIMYFDEQPAEKLTHSLSTKLKKAIVLMLLDRHFTLYTQCAIVFNTSSFQTGTRNMGNSPLLGHPHLDRYNCFGNHREAIFESAQNNDYIGAIEQISQAVLNLNFYDSCVINYTLETLEAYMNTLKTWKDPTTEEMITTLDALKRGGYYEKIES